MARVITRAIPWNAFYFFTGIVLVKQTALVFSLWTQLFFMRKDFSSFL